MLPDSLKGIFVKLDRKSRLSGIAIVNFLTLNGWHFVNYGDRREGVINSPAYVLKREIFLNDKDYEAILIKLYAWMKDY